ncbi:MAG: DUF5663 domain-containing protein [Candidatus Microsaccharimonas sp.]
MDQLDAFITEIIDAKQLSGINDEVKASLLEDLRKQLLDQVDRALLEELTDEQLDEFNEHMDQPDLPDDAPEKFLVEHGVDIERVTAKAMLKFRDLYLQPAQEREEA